MSRTATAQIEPPGMPGYDALFQQPPLVEWFRRLYREVTALKARLAEAPPLAGPGDVGTVGEGGGDGEAAAVTTGLTTAEVHGRLRSILDERPSAGGGSHVEEVRYALAAMADEVFIHLPWSGSEAWRFNLLEAALFPRDVHRVPSARTQAEAFALTVALHQRGLFSWSEWAQALSASDGRKSGDSPHSVRPAWNAW